MWPNDPDGFEAEPIPPENTDDALYIVVLGDDILAAGSPWRPLDADQFRWLDVEIVSQHYLGRLDGSPTFVSEAKGGCRAPEGYGFIPLGSLMGNVDQRLFYLAGRAVQVVKWYLDHRFCGRCGVEADDHQRDRAKVCPKCGLTSYPRLSPSIIVLVRRGDQMLLARNARWRAGMFSTLAGFIEPGESIEQAVHREVYEEVGLSVKDLNYLGSQSWPFPNSLMIGYHAEYAGGDIDCRDGEIAEAKWFDYNNIPAIPPATAISRWLIDAFVNEKDT